jgi:hypothetical protein
VKRDGKEEGSLIKKCKGKIYICQRRKNEGKGGVK